MSSHWYGGCEGCDRTRPLIPATGTPRGEEIGHLYCVQCHEEGKAHPYTKADALADFSQLAAVFAAATVGAGLGFLLGLLAR